MAPSAERLRDAILANAEGLVASYLDAGADPNQVAKWPTLSKVTIGSDNVEEDAFIVKNCVIDDKFTGISSVHVAVVNIYHNHDEHSNHPSLKASLKILEKLLESGAKADGLMEPCCSLCNIRGYNWKPLPRAFTPIDLAVYLKSYKNPCACHDDEKLCNALDWAIKRIGQALTDPNVPHVSVAKSVVDMLQRMVLSEEFSDVRFKCADGTSLPAHKCVLSSSSTYFRNYFTGPWGKLAEHQGGTWRTSHSSVVMRAILTFIYTGEVPSSLLESNAPTMLAASSEYDLPELVKLSEAGCIRTMDDDNVKAILILANLHASKKLKEACFAYVRNNAQVLTNPDMMSLSGEDADLWEELRAEITPPSKRPKKQK